MSTLSRTWDALSASIIAPPLRFRASPKSWANWRNDACASAMPTTCATIERTFHRLHTVSVDHSSERSVRSRSIIRANSVPASRIASV
jgi:hypothetical protein